MPHDASAPLALTALNAQHRALGGRMVPFAGYEMPVQYEGVLAEHRWTREHAGLFDVSHMGPAVLKLNAPSGDGETDHAAVCALIEPLIPTDMTSLAPGQLRYTMLLNDQGGVLDDLMIGRPADGAHQGELFIVVNAGTNDADYALIAASVARKASLVRLEGWSLLALQGPDAAAVLKAVVPAADDLGFMQWARLPLGGGEAIVARSGYTGEDGFEITLPDAQAADLWTRLLADDRVRPIGLGARDSLRLEAGMPLYGHDLGPDISPVEAGLPFVIAKRRRAAGDFPGAPRILQELKDGPPRVRVALTVQGAPAREGAQIAAADGAVIGVVTSGGFSPTLSAPIALGFAPPALSSPGTELQVIVRGKAQAAVVVPLPFVPHRYVRKPFTRT